MFKGYTDYKVKGEGLKDLIEAYGDDGDRVLVGVPKGAGSYKDGTLIAVIAAVNEFGSADGRIPERPALRNGVSNALPQIKLLVKKSIPKINSGDMTFQEMLDLIGHLAVGNIQQTISEGVSPANAASTIKRKKSSTPLIDTGDYRQSITHVVRKG